jgi:hypothetical protein
MRPSFHLIAALTVPFAAATSRAAAQAPVPQYRGDYGIESGTQAPPGTWMGVLYNYYRARIVRDNTGTRFPISTTISNAALLGEYSSTETILGGRWAARIIVPWASRAFGLPQIAITDGRLGFSDLYIQPLQLGWQVGPLDFLFGQGVFAPTGRFTEGADNNTGLGMWSYETTAGSTLYADSARTLSVSALASYQIQSHVRGSDKRAGQTLTIEGGLGTAFPRWTQTNGRLGMAYYTRWKITADHNYPLPQTFRHRDQYYAFGPELTANWVAKAATTVVTLRYFFEGGNLVAPQGDSFYVIANLYLPNAKAGQPTVAKK